MTESINTHAPKTTTLNSFSVNSLLITIEGEQHLHQKAISSIAQVLNVNIETQNVDKSISQISIPARGQARNLDPVISTIKNHCWMNGYASYTQTETGDLIEKFAINDCEISICTSTTMLTDSQHVLEVLPHPQQVAVQLTNEQITSSKKIKKELSDQAQNSAYKARKLFVNKRSLEFTKQSEMKVGKARALIWKALDNKILEPDYLISLSDGSTITISEILETPEDYHHQTTLCPINPDSKNLGKLFLLGGTKYLRVYTPSGEIIYRLVSQRQSVIIKKGDTAETINRTLSMLEKRPDVFLFNDQLVTVIEGKLIRFDEHLLSHYLASIIQYRRVSDKDAKETLPIDPPDKLLKSLISISKYHNFQIISSVITIPTIDVNGKLISKQGYNEDSGIYVDLESTFPEINETPSHTEVKSAVNELMFVFKDFPFAGILDKSVHLAAILTAIVRPTLRTLPAFSYDASTQGSGKTLLAQTIGAIASGQIPTVWLHTDLKNDEEMRKRLLTIGLNDQNTYIHDNIVGQFKSATLASVLTSGLMSDRKLGTNESPTINFNCLVLLTGNNMLFDSDLVRRVFTSRLESNIENPHHREFDIDPLLYCLENRHQLVNAALTILLGWFNSIEYLRDWKPEGSIASFEKWADLVRTPIAWLGEYVMPGEYCDISESLNKGREFDSEAQALISLFHNLYDHFEDRSFTSKELSSFLKSGSMKAQEITETLEDCGQSKLSPLSLGKFLGERRGRIAGGIRLHKIQDSTKNSARWKLTKIE
tara:strand:+ start:10396 stop:12699 length:2304 start_codon:yes stop_codon:yes gene_type:complete